MTDIIESLGSSILQHGGYNDRIYVMKLDGNDYDRVFTRINELCEKNKYSKVVVKSPRFESGQILSLGYKIEANIPNYYNGKGECILLSKFFSRQRSSSNDIDTIKSILGKAEQKRKITYTPELDVSYSLKIMAKKDVSHMAKLYKKVFKSYPFPIFDPDYLLKTMNDNVEYAGIWHGKKLVSLASAEKCYEYKNVEMTDFATLPDYRGNNFSLILLDFLEKRVIGQGFKVLYTIARSLSPGMNITFRKKGYKYTGTLINNTNISGQIESMNVWYKNVELSRHLMQVFTADKVADNIREPL